MKLIQDLGQYLKAFLKSFREESLARPCNEFGECRAVSNNYFDDSQQMPGGSVWGWFQNSGNIE